MKYKKTKCRSCGTQDKLLFTMPVMVDDKDYFCKECKTKELEKRAKGINQ